MTEQEFADRFENFIKKKRDEMYDRYDRVLPSGEYIFNRFDKAAYLDAGRKSSIYDTSVVMGHVEIGENVWIGPYTLLEGINGSLRIGDWVSIDAGVMIYTHDSTKRYVSGGVEPILKGDVSIGSNTVIGTMTTVACGVTIGKHCVIGANSYVNKDVPDNTIVAGTPAAQIGKVLINEDNTVEFVYL